LQFTYNDGNDRERLLDITGAVRVYPRVHTMTPPFDTVIDDVKVDNEGNDVLLYTKRGVRHEIYLEDIDTVEVY